MNPNTKVSSTTHKQGQVKVPPKTIESYAITSADKFKHENRVTLHSELITNISAQYNAFKTDRQAELGSKSSSEDRADFLRRFCLKIGIPVVKVSQILSSAGKGYFWKPTDEFSNIATEYIAIRPSIAEAKDSSTSLGYLGDRHRGSLLKVEKMYEAKTFPADDNPIQVKSSAGDTTAIEIGSSVSGEPPIIDRRGMASEVSDLKNFFPVNADKKVVDAHKKLMALLTSDVDVA